MDPKHPGEDRGGDFCGESEQRCGAVLPWLDPDLVEALSDPVVPEGVPRASSGEQPGDVIRGAYLGLAAAGRDELEDEAGQRCGKDDWRGAERDRDDALVDVDVESARSLILARR
ncbi:hypothetical protein ACH4E9_28845 [Streptomyces anulatus]